MGWKEKGNYFIEEIELAVDGLNERVKELVREGNVRSLIIRKDNGDKLLEIPLTAGVAVGGVIAVIWPVVAAAAAVTGLLTRIKIQVVRKWDD
ncbi:MAG: DUF4342 domain-containing protein [Syntrophomonadaceae bacterium]|nr:DUF4342 domain-containing protein [Syntrophomonadaceae bacterium]